MALTKLNNQSIATLTDFNLSADDLPANSVLNIYETGPSTDQSVSSTSYTDVLTFNVTPTDASSKFFLLLQGHARLGGGAQARHMVGFRFARTVGGTETGLTNSGGTVESMHISGASNTNELDGTIGRSLLDSPNTTSTITYKVQMRAHNSFTNTAYLFRDAFGTKFTVIEIAG